MKARIVRRAPTVGVVLAFCLAVGSASAQFELREQTATANGYATVKVISDQRVTWVPIQPLDLKLEQYEIRENGKVGWLAILKTGNAGEVYYLDASQNGPEQPKHIRLKITVGGSGPTPPPPPDDWPDATLRGLAKQIYNKAVLIKDPENAQKIAGVAAGVVDRIDSNAITTASQAHTELKAGMPRLPRAWKPTGDLMTDALNKYAQTLNGARDTINAMAEGLGAIR